MFFLYLSIFSIIQLILIFYGYKKYKYNKIKNSYNIFILTNENKERFINIYSGLITNWFIKHIHSHRTLDNYISYHCCRKLREFKTNRDKDYEEYHKAAKDIRDYFYSSVFFYDPYKLKDYLRFQVIQHLKCICDFRNMNKRLSEIKFITTGLKNTLLECIEDHFINTKPKEIEKYYFVHFINIIEDFDKYEMDIKRFFNSLPGIRDYN